MKNDSSVMTAHKVAEGDVEFFLSARLPDNSPLIEPYFKAAALYLSQRWTHGPVHVMSVSNGAFYFVAGGHPDFIQSGDSPQSTGLVSTMLALQRYVKVSGSDSAKEAAAALLAYILSLPNAVYLRESIERHSKRFCE